MILRHRRLACLVAILAAAGPASRAQAPPALPDHLTPEAVRAIDRGIQFLVRNQAPDGCWRHMGGRGQYPVAMTALAGLALLGNGSTTTQGPHAPFVRRATEYLLSSAGRSGLISRMEEEGRSMHGHGYAMLFLSQVYGMTEDAQQQERIRVVLERGAELTARSQSRLGGWLYTPDADGDEGSVTVTQVQGLRSCRNAGITVPKATIDRAMKYLDKSVLPDGGIAYRAGLPAGSRPPITAAAVACWYNAGLYEHPNAVRALAYCKRNIGIKSLSRDFGGHYYYAHLYMAQVMYLAGEQTWNDYFPKMRDHLLSLQAEDGSWYGDGVGTTYGTAIALIILQLPYGYLPIMQR